MLHCVPARPIWVGRKKTAIVAVKSFKDVTWQTMKIYLYIDGADLNEIGAPVAEAISDWLANTGSKAQLVNRGPEDGANQTRVGDWDLGLTIETGKKADLKAPLAFLYELARQQECDFVVGIYDAQTGQPENVCYFGHEEGRPDLFEIASYLGLKR